MARKTNRAQRAQPERQSARYYVQTMPGLETVAWEEIHARLPSAALRGYRSLPGKNGLVLFQWDGDPAETLRLSIAEDVFILMAQRRVAWGYEGLSQIYDLMKNPRGLGRALALRGAALGTAIRGRSPELRVVARLSGSKQPYRRVDLQRSVGKALAKRPGRKAPHSRNDYVEVWANLIGLEYICGVRVSGAAMRHREYKIAHRPASLRPSVAAAMVWLTKPTSTDVFLDPFCGVATLLIERDRAGRHRCLLAGDLDPSALGAASENVGPRHKPRQLFRWDARRLPFAPASIGKVASNLPFGVKIDSTPDTPTLYRAFTHELDRVLTGDGRAVLLTSQDRLMRTLVSESPGLVISRRLPIVILGRRASLLLLERPAPRRGA